MMRELDTAHIPELRNIGVWIQTHHHIYQKIFDTYISLMHTLISLSQEDISRIEIAREKMRSKNIQAKNASRLNLTDFYQKIIKNKTEVHELILGISSRSTDRDVMQKLQAMLEGGSKIALALTEKPKDGDAIWDKVIWGHTQFKSDISIEVMIHFLISHYLSQYMKTYLGEGYGLTQKDDFLNAITEVIVLQVSKDLGYRDIYQVWLTSKEDGGLGWIDLRQLGLYTT